MFVPEYPIEGLKPAPYNPRRIAPDALTMLVDSIMTIGFAKPIIVNHSKTTIAGHQRSKAAKVIGMTHLPAFVVKDAPPNDEVLFNQLHNGTDVEECATDVWLPPTDRLGYEIASPADVKCDARMPGAVFRSQICRLTVKYGLWGSAIATQSGKVIASRQVAAAYKTMGQQLRVFRIPDNLEAAALDYTSRQYGEYSYAHIERHSWIQTLAQPFRLRNDQTAQRSRLYEDLLLKEIQRGTQVLDFGCGQGDYVDQLTKIGYHMFGVEFFFRVKKDIDTGAVHRMIDKFTAQLHRRGRFDMTICDSVLNSVNTVQAEADVLTCLSAFTKPGGAVFASSRKREQMEQKHRGEQYTNSKNAYLWFVDEHGFTAYLREGSWFFQKYHTKGELQGLLEKYVGPVTKIVQNSGYWLMRAEKRVELPEADVAASIEREFNLDWPEGKRVNRHEQALAAWRAAGKIETSI